MPSIVMNFGDLQDPTAFVGASKSVLLCDAPFLEGLSSEGFSDRSHNVDVPDDLLACTPIGGMSGWDTPPESPQHISMEMLDGEDPMLSDKLNSVFDDNSMSFYDWTPPESPCESDEECSDLLGGFPDLASFGVPPSVQPLQAASSAVDHSALPLKLDGLPMHKISNKRKASGMSADEREKKRAKEKQEQARIAHTEACERAVRALAHSKNDEDPESKRHTHNVLERKRRNDLKNSYQLLRERVPSLEDDDRAPTGKILLHAVEFIQHLQKTEQILDSEMARTQTENDRLRRLAGIV